MNDFKWKFIDSGVNSAKTNMTLDEELLKGLCPESSRGILHLYDWKTISATYGHFIDPYKLLNKTTVLDSGLELAKRPTGGGIIFHLTDFAFSLLIPARHPNFSINTLENYVFVNQLLIEILEEFVGTPLACHLLPIEPVPQDSDCAHFCMAKPTKYDVVMNDGRKMVGGAQRRTKNGFLHQGTISLALPHPYFLDSILLPGTKVLESMQTNTCTLLEGNPLQKEIDEARRSLRNIFIKKLCYE